MFTFHKKYYLRSWSTLLLKIKKHNCRFLGLKADNFKIIAYKYLKSENYNILNASRTYHSVFTLEINKTICIN